MVCANTDPFVLSIVCIVNITICLYFFIPFSCKSCHAIHDFLGGKLFALFSLDMALFFAALVSTVAPDSWPRNAASQIWIILSFWIFFYLIFDVLWVIILPLSALSLMDPVWNVIREVIRSNWKYAFGVDASDGLVIATFIFVLLVASIITILIFYFKFLHRIYYSFVLVVLFVMSMKAFINNVPAGEICCDFTGSQGLDRCPILFDLTYFLITIFLSLIGISITMYKYDMLCCERIKNNKSKSKQDKTNSTGESNNVENKTKAKSTFSSSSQFYNRIDSTDTEEFQSLVKC